MGFIRLIAHTGKHFPTLSKINGCEPATARYN
jgi:hypothetical protein